VHRTHHSPRCSSTLGPPLPAVLHRRKSSTSHRVRQGRSRRCLTRGQTWPLPSRNRGYEVRVQGGSVLSVQSTSPQASTGNASPTVTCTVAASVTHPRFASAADTVARALDERLS
jgi:hypothetical protein